MTSRCIPARLKTPAWVLKDGARFLLDLFKVVTYESDRPAKLAGMIQGTFHALIRKRGQRPYGRKRQ